MTLGAAGMGNQITCPNCSQPYQARIEQIIDVDRDPAAKSRFLSGQTNVGTCPNCGYRIGLATPLLYHDPEKELFLVYVPLELGLQQQEQERIIGQLVKAVMDNTPAEKRRGYMFQPRTMLSLQGMVETVLGADGITPEMLEAQRAKMRLVETFLQTDEDQLPELVAQHDDQIDREFLEIIGLAAENARASGRADMAEYALGVRDKIMALSTAGKALMQDVEAQEAAIQTVMETLQGLGEQPTVDAFIDAVVGMADDDHQLQALVGLQYPVLNYEFFQALAARIDQASANEKTALESVRARLLELTDLIKEQQEAQAKAAAMVLNDIVNSDDLEEAIERNAPYIDELFMMVLSANLKAAEDRNDLVASARLKKVSEAVNTMVEASIPPEVRFVSNLLQIESLEEAQSLIDAEANQYGESLLSIMDVLLRDLEARGENGVAERVSTLRAHTARVLN